MESAKSIDRLNKHSFDPFDRSDGLTKQYAYRSISDVVFPLRALKLVSRKHR
ncbi:MAG: hypothetical protein J7641_16250 [Cyanobacteria bacterium SID2]|nr:hypothetical protein [Cyanobacteria bacterium SID2]MBP0005998.1 hypothetical protein [Cyanobacteria bacterium SBC]